VSVSECVLMCVMCVLTRCNIVFGDSVWCGGGEVVCGGGWRETEGR